MMYDIDCEEMLDRILEWAETKDKFDASTFEGIKDHYEKYDEFTSRQIDAIENVYSKWKIDKWYYDKQNITKKKVSRSVKCYTIAHLKRPL